MEKEEFDKIVLREKERRLSISRIPKKTKEEFIDFANEEFCEDYGMAFRDIWEDAKLFRKIKDMLLKDKLKLKLEILNRIEKGGKNSDGKTK